MGWFQDQAQNLLQQYQQAQQPSPQQQNPWGATPATPNATRTPTGSQPGAFGWAQSPARQAALQGSGLLAQLGGGNSFDQHPPLLQDPAVLQQLFNGQTPPGWFNPGWGSEMPQPQQPSFKNGPQPVPGMPPQPMPPNDGDIHAGTPGFDAPWPTTGPFNPALTGSQGPNNTIVPPWFADPNNPNRTLPNGSGQPINQPMGSLAQLGGMGGGQMVTLRGPDGTTKAVPQSDMAHWLSRGATMAMGG